MHLLHGEKELGSKRNRFPAWAPEGTGKFLDLAEEIPEELIEE
jgi:hypothetical protein